MILRRPPVLAVLNDPRPIGKSRTNKRKGVLLAVCLCVFSGSALAIREVIDRAAIVKIVATIAQLEEVWEKLNETFGLTQQIWQLDFPGLGETPADITGVVAESNTTAVRHSQTTAAALAAPPNGVRLYKEVASWTRETPKEVLTPVVYTPGDNPDMDEAAKNATVLAGLYPVEPPPTLLAGKTLGQEFDAVRGTLVANHALAHQAILQYPMAAEEIARYEEVLTTLTPDRINTLESGQTLKATLNLLAIQTRMQLSMYQSLLRQERAQGVMIGTLANQAYRTRLNALTADLQ